MTMREGGLWSRAWGALALMAFAIHLGATVYEDAVVAPLWMIDPPGSVTAWNGLALRPDGTSFFQALTAIVCVTTAMAWMSGLGSRGWRRWWLTLALVCAGGLAAVTMLYLMPAERWLFGAGALQGNDAAIVAWSGDWLRASAMRLALLIAGAWAALRAHASMAPARTFELGEVDEPFVAGQAGPRRKREFVFGDERDAEITFGDEPANPRQRWRDSLPRTRRTAKK
jgi:hypothetical protein